MTIKQLTHNIITFCNNYIDNKNIIFSISKYPTFIDVTFSIWALNNKKGIGTYIGSISKYMYDENDFNDFKNKVINELPELLKRI